MTQFVFAPPEIVSVPVKDAGAFPVRRIFCIGRNYGEHVREMGNDPKSTPPVFFTKPRDAVVCNGAAIAYPPATTSLHFEGELVLALKDGGAAITDKEHARGLIFGFAAGCDLTRRDLQAAAKAAAIPWDLAKGFDRAAPIGEITPYKESVLNDLKCARLVTYVNGDKKQDAPLSEMIWSAEEIIIALSEFFELKPGDIIFTGTPEGVGPINPGDDVRIEIGPLNPLNFSIVARP